MKEGSESGSAAGFEDEGGDMAKEDRKLLEIKSQGQILACSLQGVKLNFSPGRPVSDA